MLKTSSGARSARNSSYLARIQFTQELRKVENREQSLQRCLAFDKFIMDRRQQNSIEYPEPTETLLFYGAPQPNRVRAVLMRGQFFPFEKPQNGTHTSSVAPESKRRRVENFIIISSATTSSHSINSPTASVEYFSHSPAFHDSTHILEQHSQTVIEALLISIVNFPRCLQWTNNIRLWKSIIIGDLLCA